MVKNPVEIYDHVMFYQHLVLCILGVDVYSANHSVNVLTVSMISMSLFFQFVSFYDLSVVFRNDLFGKAFVMSTICFSFIGCLFFLFLFLSPIGVVKKVYSIFMTLENM